jgi:hypothetical protein
MWTDTSKICDGDKYKVTISVEMNCNPLYYDQNIEV